jgi:hypothetical protein
MEDKKRRERISTIAFIKQWNRCKDLAGFARTFGITQEAAKKKYYQINYRLSLEGYEPLKRLKGMVKRDEPKGSVFAQLELGKHIKKKKVSKK